MTGSAGRGERIDAPRIGAEDEPSREEIDRTPGLLLLEFGTEWCGYCRALEPRVSSLLARHPEIRHLRIDDGPGQPLGRSFGVKLWPNLVFLRDGVVVRQLARPGAAQLQEAFDALTGGAEDRPARG